MNGEIGMSDLVYQAMTFAMEAHKDQKRKYTNEPYFLHLAEVAGIVSSVISGKSIFMQQVMLATAWLHDTIEDTGVSYGEIANIFGGIVAEDVYALSDLEEGNRKERKAKSRERLSMCLEEVQTIKCADLISNTSSILQHDERFAKVYLEEKRELLKVLTKADRRLWDIAAKQCGLI